MSMFPVFALSANAAAAADEVAENVANTKDSIMSSLGLDLSSVGLTAIISGIIILIVCLIAIKVINGIVGKILARSRLDKTLHAFIKSAVNVLLYILTAIVVVGSMGFNVSSLVAVLSVAGLAVSLAMQNSLSNLAGGIMLLATKPIVVGDFVEVGGQTGTVLEIGMAYTKINTLDNKRISIPNSTISAANIVNYSTEGKRRVDLDFNVSYDNDPGVVCEALLVAIARCGEVLGEKDGVDAPFARLSAYGESTVTYTVRVWCANADYWTVYFFLLEEAGRVFKEKGVRLSYPRVCVQMEK